MQLPNTARCLLAAAGIAAASMTTAAAAQSAFTYQGVLEEGGSAVTGTENIRFRIFDAQTGGTLFGETTQNVDVEDGVFAAELNFGPLSTIDPDSAWLEIAVNTGPGTFETLGRQKITSAPFATNTRGLNVDSSGRLSVGTDSHQDILHIAGNNARILTESTSGFFSGIRSRVAGKEFFTGVDTFPGAANGGAGWHVFDNTGSGRLLALLPNGNFGVGVSIPQARLDVNGSGTFSSSVGSVGIGAVDGASGVFETNNAGEPTNNFMRFVGFNDTKISAGAFMRFFVDSAERVLVLADSTRINNDVHAFGRVGVGTNNPGFPITVEGDGSGGSIGVRSTTGGSGYHLDFNGGSLSIVESGDKIRATFLDDDRLAIGSNFGFTNVGVNVNLPFTFGLLLQQGDAGKPGGGSWANTSDERLKTNIEDLDGALDTLLSLRGVTYEYKDPDAIGELHGTRTGFIAQEAEEVIPDWVWDAEDGYKRMTIRGFEAMAVEAIRELKTEKDAEIAALETRLESLESQRSVVGASMVWPVLLGGGVLAGFAVARRRIMKSATEA